MLSCCCMCVVPQTIQVHGHTIIIKSLQLSRISIFTFWTVCEVWHIERKLFHIKYYYLLVYYTYVLCWAPWIHHFLARDRSYKLLYINNYPIYWYLKQLNSIFHFIPSVSQNGREQAIFWFFVSFCFVYLLCSLSQRTSISTIQGKKKERKKKQSSNCSCLMWPLLPLLIVYI